MKLYRQPKRGCLTCAEDLQKLFFPTIKEMPEELHESLNQAVEMAWIGVTRRLDLMSDPPPNRCVVMASPNSSLSASVDAFVTSEAGFKFVGGIESGFWSFIEKEIESWEGDPSAIMGAILHRMGKTEFARLEGLCRIEQEKGHVPCLTVACCYRAGIITVCGLPS